MDASSFPFSVWALGIYTGPVPRGDGLLTHDLNPQEKGPQDACGVFGVFAPGEDVAKLTYFGLFALQHRGQESAGMAVSDGQQTVVYKDMGLVSQVFTEGALASLPGHLAIGNSRYSTTGSSVWENAQPTFRATATGHLALAHNGNLTNTHLLAERVAEVERQCGHAADGHCDGLDVRHRAAHGPARRLPRGVADDEPRSTSSPGRGAFSLVFMDDNDPVRRP